MNDLVADNYAWAQERIAGMRFRKTDAEDLEQEAMVGLCKAARAWDGKGEFRAFAWVCMRNQMIDWLRKERRYQDHEMPAGLRCELSGTPK